MPNTNHKDRLHIFYSVAFGIANDPSRDGLALLTIRKELIDSDPEISPEEKCRVETDYRLAFCFYENPDGNVSKQASLFRDYLQRISNLYSSTR